MSLSSSEQVQEKAQSAGKKTWKKTRTANKKKALKTNGQFWKTKGHF